MAPHNRLSPRGRALCRLVGRVTTVVPFKMSRLRDIISRSLFALALRHVVWRSFWLRRPPEAWADQATPLKSSEIP